MALRRRLIWDGLAMLASVLALAGAAATALYTTFGARAAWRLAEIATVGALSGEVQTGTLSQGLQLRDLRYADDKRRVAVDRADARWHFQFSPPRLMIAELALGRVDVVLLPTPPKPLELPQSLRLPLSISLRQATLQSLTIEKYHKVYAFADLSLNGHTDGVHHVLQVEHLVTPLGIAAGLMHIDADRPFALFGRVRLDEQTIGEAYAVQAELSGSLARLEVAAALRSDKAHGTAEIAATPFAPIPFSRLRIEAAGLDASALKAGLPRTVLDIHADLKPVAGTATAEDLSRLQVAGPVSVTNRQPGPLDAHRLPVISLTGMVRLGREAQFLRDVVVKLPDGARLTGGVRNRSPLRGELELQAHGLNLASLHSALRPTALDGPLTVAFDQTRQRVRLDLADAAYSVKAAAEIDSNAIVLDTAKLRSGPALLALSGRLSRGARADYVLQGRLADFDPGRFLRTLHLAAPRPQRLPFDIYRANINSQFDASGTLNPGFSAQVGFHIHDSTYNALPMQGDGSVQIAANQVLHSDIRLSIAGNDLRAQGAFGKPGDRLDFDLGAPALDRLGFGLAGRLRLMGNLAGTLQRPAANADFTTEALRFGRHRLAHASGTLHLQGLPVQGQEARLRLDLEARGYHSDAAQLAQLSAHVSGSDRNHNLRLAGLGRLHGQPFDLALEADGRLQHADAGFAWAGTVQRFDNKVFPKVHLLAPARLSAAPDRLQLGLAKVNVENTQVAFERLSYDAGAIDTSGAIHALRLADLLQLRKQLTGVPSPVQTDLVLDAQWDFVLSRNSRGYLRLGRTSGDLRLPRPEGDTLLGLQKLELGAVLQDASLTLHAEAEADRMGRLQGSGSMGLDVGGGLPEVTPQSPVEGRITMSVPALEKVGAFAGPRISVTGKLAADVRVAGTLGDTRLSGSIDGAGLALTLYDQGIRLRDGTAHVVLHDDVLDIRQAVFHGGKGELRITGSVPLDPRRPDVSATMVADKLQLLADPSSRLMLSGRAGIGNTSGHLSVTGKFVVDSAWFSLPETPAPKLGDDVVVVRENVTPGGTQTGREVPREASPGFWSPSIDLSIDLGRDFRFEGRGAKLRLAGSVDLVKHPPQPPQARGTVKVAEGTFEALGTKLAIERGILNFQGPMDNPSINILAMRRHQEVAAGIQITGTADHPRAALVSEPDVPDEQKLSWLVFGHAGGMGGPGQNQAAAQGAVLALLSNIGGKTLARNLGLDEISLGASPTGGQLLTLGKSISNKLTIGYQQGLTSAESAVELTYLLSQHWSVVTRGGQILGINILYSHRFD